MKRTILLDADITAYHIAANHEEKFEFEGQVTRLADWTGAKIAINEVMEYIQDITGAHQMVLFMTEGNNFRKTVLPTYKGNRNPDDRPALLGDVRQYMKDHFKVITEPGIEADDLLGIHATMPHKGERVIMSADKDLKTVPALHWHHEMSMVEEVSQQDADRFFYEQILTGDPTDNYKGCPGVGKVAASAMLDDPFKWVKTSRILTRGKNKGQEKIEWVKEPVEVQTFQDTWSCIVSAYEKVGLTDQDALVQARCARILRHGEYDFKQKKVKLWEPK